MPKRPSSPRLRVAILLPLAVLAALAIPAGPAGAAASRTFSFTSSATSSANDGAIDLRTLQPIVNAGNQTATIVNEIDPTAVRIMDPATDVIAPEGWVVTYSTDGTNWFSYNPNQPWTWDPYAGVRFIRATGTVDAVSVFQGRVAARTTDTYQAAGIGSFSATGGGDGWDVQVDTATGNIYNLWHHDGYWGSGFSTGSLDCRSKVTGAQCAGSWPFRVTDLTNPNAMHTGDQAWQYLDQPRQRILFPTSTSSKVGFGCIDVSDSTAPKWCGGSLQSGFIQTANVGAIGRNSITGMTVAGGKIFTISTSTGRLQCVDLATTTPCADQPIDLSLGYTEQAKGSLVTLDGKVVGVQNGRWLCVDPATMGTCSGWTQAATTSYSSLNGGWNSNLAMAFILPSSSGADAAVCAYSAKAGFPWDPTIVNPLDCRDASGAPVVPNAALSTAMATKLGKNPFGSAKPYPHIGPRLYFNTVYGGGGLYCFNLATGDWCANWGSSARGDWTMYTVTADPANASCLWTNGDAGSIVGVNALTGEGGCPASGPAQVTFNRDVLIPRLSCAGTAVTQWQQFVLTEPALGVNGGARSATVSVTDSSGSPIPGWTDRALPNSGRLSLQGLPLSATGQQPRFTLNFTDRKASSINTTAQLVSVSDQPELCVHATIDQCPHDAPMGLIGTVPPTKRLSLTSTGTALGASASRTIAVTAISPGDTCGTTIRGTARTASGQPVAGARVQLHQGGYWFGPRTPVLDSGGRPVVAITGADGTYRFPGLGQNDAVYSVAFSSINPSSTVASTEWVAGSGVIPAVGSPEFSEIVWPDSRVEIVDAVYTGPGTLPPSAPTDRVLASGDGKVIVTWNPPDNDGGSPVTSYRVVAPDGQACTVNVPAARTCEFQGLTNGAVGTFTFYAFNANGPSFPATSRGAAGGFAGGSGLHLQVLSGRLLKSSDLATWTQFGTVPGSTNALAYQPFDGYAYALSNGQPKQLLRLAGDGTVTVLGRVINQDAVLTAAAIDPATGDYYVGSEGGTLFRVLRAGTGTFRLEPVTLQPGVVLGQDFVINAGVLTTIANSRVYRWTIGTTAGFNTGAALAVPPSPGGAMWTDPSGGSFFRVNAWNRIYRLTFSGEVPSMTLTSTDTGVDRTPVDGATVVDAAGNGRSFAD